MAPTYFSAVFKKFNGISPWDYITIKRVEKAKEMLCTESAKVSDIAISVGYPDVFRFSKMFRQYVGMSPSAYSRMMAKGK